MFNRIAKLPDGSIPREDEFHFRTRCYILCERMKAAALPRQGDILGFPISLPAGQAGPMTLEQHLNLLGTLLSDEWVALRKKEHFAADFAPRRWSLVLAGPPLQQRHDGLEIINAHLLERLQQAARQNPTVPILELSKLKTANDRLLAQNESLRHEKSRLEGALWMLAPGMPTLPIELVMHIFELAAQDEPRMRSTAPHGRRPEGLPPPGKRTACALALVSKHAHEVVTPIMVSVPPLFAFT